MALLSEHGELPPVDGWIFADTQSEPAHVYETLEWLTAAMKTPIYRVSAGNLREDILQAARSGATRPGGTVGQPPFFVKNRPNLAYATADSGGRLWRKCTPDYKIVPIRRKIRELLGLTTHGTPRGLRVEQWIGFSLDDLGRTFCSDVRWITNTFPLILPLRMRRRQCVAWLQAHGYPVPRKSSCTFCPYHSNAAWRDMRDNRPDEWVETVAFEQQLQAGKLPGVRGIPYLHKSMVPLPMVALEAPDEGPELFCLACNT
jgi:hypothetical protein